MKANKKAPRLLGAAFLFVLFASILSGLLLTRAFGSGSSMSDILVEVSDNLTLMRMSILVGLATSIGIVVLGVLLYDVLKEQNETIALVALGWWLAEAITLAVSKIGLLALIPISMDFVEKGAPEPSYFLSLGDLLYSGVFQRGDDVHMWFYCLGGILWFYLFLQSEHLPRFLSGLGIAIESMGLVGMLLLLFAVKVKLAWFFPIAVLELTVGIWLMVTGGRDGSKGLAADGKT